MRALQPHFTKTYSELGLSLSKVFLLRKTNNFKQHLVESWAIAALTLVRLKLIFPLVAVE